MKNAPRVSKTKAVLVQSFFRKSFIRVVNVTRKIAERAQELVWDHGIRPKDAIHVATAEFYEVPVVETFDADLIAKSGHVGVPPIEIRKPLLPKQGSLF